MRDMAWKSCDQKFMHFDAACYSRWVDHMITCRKALIQYFPATSIASLVPNAALQAPTTYLENKFGTATTALSLATNITATVLIAFKAW